MKSKKKLLYTILFLGFVCIFFEKCNRDLDIEQPGSTISAPKNLTMLSAGDGSINIEWSSNDKNTLGYNVYLSSSNSPSIYLKIFSTQNNYYQIKNLEYDTTYCIKVTAYNDFQESLFSNSVEGKPFNIYAPRTPYGLEVYGNNIGKVQMLVNWVPNQEGDIDKYLIYRSDDFGNLPEEFIQIATTNISYFVDSVSLTLGKKYHYGIICMDKGGLKSRMSSTDNDYILPKPILFAPSDKGSISDKIEFKWKKVENVSLYILNIYNSIMANPSYSFDVESSVKDTINFIVNPNYFASGKFYYWKVSVITKDKKYPNSQSEFRSFYFINNPEQKF